MSDITQQAGRRRPLVATLETILEEGIRDGKWPKGTKLPTEAVLLAQYGVSRTVVREAVTRLQAAGKVVTRHGIGTFVVNSEASDTFSIRPDQMATLEEVLTVLELRIAVESEAAALAALRRTDEHLNAMATALEAFATAVEVQRDAVEHDFQFHLQIAKATGNVRFIELMAALGGSMIPRARLNTGDEITPQRVEYLRRVNDEHADIFNAIQDGDAEGARFSMRAHLTNSRRRRRLSAPAR